jgi:tetratricopeptide (TPR) repeat protein
LALVATLHKIGRTEEALEAAERGTEDAAEARSPDCWSYLARARCLLEQAGRCADAKADLDQALELAPQDPRLASAVAELYANPVYTACPEAYDEAVALDLARRAVAHDPDNPHHQDVHGLVLYRHARYEQARLALLKAHDAYPHGDPDNLLSLAMTSWKLGRATEAKSFYARAVARIEETYPKHPGYLRRMAEAATLMEIER